MDVLVGRHTKRAKQNLHFSFIPIRQWLTLEVLNLKKKPWETRGIFKFEIIIASLALSDSFKYLCYQSTTSRTILKLTVRGSTLDVRIWRLQTSTKVGPRVVIARHCHAMSSWQWFTGYKPLTPCMVTILCRICAPQIIRITETKNPSLCLKANIIFQQFMTYRHIRWTVSYLNYIYIYNWH